ncbi:hypothetical protein [Candidatus Rhabdochlamydia sp. T3358]|nr:hypothetical protein [Candidatus Rhabdochlamydia sp. T3358]VHO02746.1 hypothetical protein RHT_00640 [Candidatus Rhabdochlamydia sp. T3358]
MSQPKGKIPKHIKQKTFNHPGTDSQIILNLCKIKDPRQPSCNFHYSLVTVL